MLKIFKGRIFLSLLLALVFTIASVFSDYQNELSGTEISQLKTGLNSKNSKRDAECLAFISKNFLLVNLSKSNFVKGSKYQTTRFRNPNDVSPDSIVTIGDRKKILDLLDLLDKNGHLYNKLIIDLSIFDYYSFIDTLNKKANSVDSLLGEKLRSLESKKRIIRQYPIKVDGCANESLSYRDEEGLASTRYDTVSGTFMHEKMIIKGRYTMPYKMLKLIDSVYFDTTDFFSR
ncbi:MAG: hypothetical protein IPJ79_10140 [Bacteroidetes bacterium]|nr:hypothetical protein [Bacteroidota bacterium]